MKERQLMIDAVSGWYQWENSFSAGAGEKAVCTDRCSVGLLRVIGSTALTGAVSLRDGPGGTLVDALSAGSAVGSERVFGGIILLNGAYLNFANAADVTRVLILYTPRPV